MGKGGLNIVKSPPRKTPTDMMPALKSINWCGGVGLIECQLEGEQSGFLFFNFFFFKNEKQCN